MNFCTMTSTTHKGVKGTLLTGPNGNSIFLPFAGYRWDVNLMGIEEFGDLGDGIRSNALTVRPVRP